MSLRNTRRAHGAATEDPGELKLHIAEVLASVKTLYADELKPFGRVLLKRLRERAAAKLAAEQNLAPEAVNPETLPRVNQKHLRKLCAASRQMILTREDGREYSVTLVGQASNFLDICSSLDPYPECLWQELTAHFDTLPEGETLPGGRYACAQALVTKKLWFLKGYSLGQVCHLVQLAITQRNVLGYHDGGLVRYTKSDSYMKQVCAFTKSPLGIQNYPVVSTWDEACCCLRKLLKTQPYTTAQSITISNLKRLFTVHFQKELCETALGHVRLLDLLKDERLREICSLDTQGNGQLVIKAVGASGPEQWQQQREQQQLPYQQQPEAPMVPLCMWTFYMPPVHVQEDSCFDGALVSPGNSPGNSPRDVGPPPPAMAEEELAAKGAWPRGTEAAWSPGIASCSTGFWVDEGASSDAPSTRASPQEHPLKERSSSCLSFGATSSLSEEAKEEAKEVTTPASTCLLPPTPIRWPVSVKNTFIDVGVQQNLRLGSRSRQRSVPSRMHA